MRLETYCRSSSRRDGSTEAEDKATPDELLHGVCRSLNCGTNDNDQAPNEDAPPTSQTVRKEAAERKAGNLAEIVDDEDHALGRGLSGEPKALVVLLHGVDSTHERTVEAVHGRDEVANAHDGVEPDHVGRP